jgi:V/A-type H+-transporting ATPase subunit E
MQKTILALVQDWGKNQSITVEAKDAKALTDYFVTNAKDLLNKGVKITEANGLKADFVIIPEKEGYKITFGDDEFIAYFKEFLRPKLVEMLF